MRASDKGKTNLSNKVKPTITSATIDRARTKFCK